MRNRVFSIVSALLVLNVWWATTDGFMMAQSPPRTKTFLPDRVLVAFHPGTPAAEIQVAHAQAKARVLKTIPAIGLQVVSVPNGDVLESVARYRRNPNVRYAEPDYIRPLFRPATEEGSEPSLGISNNFNEQWGLHNTGQPFGAAIDPLFGTVTAPVYAGTPGADIHAPEAWQLTHGSPDVKIAILDSGVSCEHVDLDSKCIEQVNFVAAHGSPVNDVIGHGTHVAGIAAAETNNEVGVAGVAWDASIGSMKVCYEDRALEILGIIQGVCEDADIIEGIEYAADNGYNVINMSLAGPEDSAALEDAVNYAWGMGVVLVAGAGNDYSPEKRFPAAYDNVIAVAATDYFDNLAYFSTFSTGSDDWVSVAAPGDVIFSTVPSEFCGLATDDPEGCYDWKSGTSMATPFVSGVAAMLWAYLPNPTNDKVRTYLEKSADHTGALGQNLLAWTKFGRVNLFNALTYDPSNPGGGGGTEDTTPPEITGVLSAPLNGPRFEVKWTTDEPATSYVDFVGYGEVGNASLATEHRVIFRGQKNIEYHFSVRSADAAGNEATEGPFTFQN